MPATWWFEIPQWASSVNSRPGQAAGPPGPALPHSRCRLLSGTISCPIHRRSPLQFGSLTPLSGAVGSPLNPRTTTQGKMQVAPSPQLTATLQQWHELTARIQAYQSQNVSVAAGGRGVGSLGHPHPHTCSSSPSISARRHLP